MNKTKKIKENPEAVEFPMICPLSMQSGHILPCQGTQCMIFSEMEKDQYTCALKVFLLGGFLAWQTEQHNLRTEYEKSTKKPISEKEVT